MNTTITAITTETSYDFSFNKDYTMRKFLTNVVNGNITELEQHYANKLIAQLNKKNESKKNGTNENKTTNDNYMVTIKEMLTANPEKTFTAKEIAKALTTEEVEVSTQRVTALMTKLKESGEVEVVDNFKPDGAKSKCKGYKTI